MFLSVNEANVLFSGADGGDVGDCDGDDDADDDADPDTNFGGLPPLMAASRFSAATLFASSCAAEVVVSCFESVGALGAYMSLRDLE